MAIKIRKTIIPVTFEVEGDENLDFEFNAADISMKQLRKKKVVFEKRAKELQAEALALEDDDDVKADKLEDEIKELVKEAFDSMLGDEAFDKIYAHSPSIFYLIDYYVQLNEHLDQEINRQTKDAKAKKYLIK